MQHYSMLNNIILSSCSSTLILFFSLSVFLCATFSLSSANSRSMAAVNNDEKVQFDFYLTAINNYSRQRKETVGKNLNSEMQFHFPYFKLKKKKTVSHKYSNLSIRSTLHLSSGKLFSPSSPVKSSIIPQSEFQKESLQSTVSEKSVVHNSNTAQKDKYFPDTTFAVPCLNNCEVRQRELLDAAKIWKRLKRSAVWREVKSLKPLIGTKSEYIKENHRPKIEKQLRIDDAPVLKMTEEIDSAHGHRKLQTLTKRMAGKLQKDLDREDSSNWDTLIKFESTPTVSESVKTEKHSKLFSNKYSQFSKFLPGSANDDKGIAFWKGRVKSLKSSSSFNIPLDNNTSNQDFKTGRSPYSPIHFINPSSSLKRDVPSNSLEVADAPHSLWPNRSMLTIEEECGDGEWRCLNSSECISDLLLCSGFQDCQDGSDESVARCGELILLLHKYECKFFAGS